MLNPQPGQSYLDGTAGYGGHATAIATRLGPTGQLTLVDRDADAISVLTEQFGSRATIIQNDYLAAVEEMLAADDRFDMILLDVGVSSPQLDVAARGFSFRSDGPLDMRMDQSEGETAADLVNTLPEAQLADLIYRYGEDRKSRRIAKAIVAARPLTTTTQLAEVIGEAVGYREEIHPATRTFQALRIAVNDELRQLESALPVLNQLLNPGGRLAIISFHSLEDRIVKTYFRTESRDCICPSAQPICTCDHVATLKLLTKRPIAGTDDAFNPRARSAKLRVAEKLTPKKELP